MRLDDGRESENIEDRRGARGGLPGGGRSIGIGTIVLALVAMYFGVDPSVVLNMGAGLPDARQQAPVQPGVQSTGQAEQDGLARFTSRVLADNEDTWGVLFRAGGGEYREPRLVLYTGGTQTGCGVGQAAMGPFYCPADERVYLDLGFYDDLQRRFGAPGDFAQAYVIAHEVGHHVQNLEGTSAKLDQARRRVSQAEYNALSVRLELQADCYAGIWAHDTQQSKGLMESGDLEEAMNAASQIGDDALQRGSGREVVPESFTHGSSAQRMRWLKRGFESGDMAQCDTFNTRAL